MRIASLRRVLGALPGLLLAAPLAAAPATVLGDGAELYRAIPGLYGELFPEGAAAAAEAPVLALEVVRPGHERELLLVPGSEGAEADRSATMIFEEDSATAYVIWESRTDDATSRVLLAGLRGDDWLEPVELTGDVDPLKGPPAVLLTRDRYTRATITEGVVSRARTILHVVWWERGAGGAESVQYTPVVLESGAYVGWNPVFRLNDLDPGEIAADAPSDAAIYRSPTLAAGTDLHTVMIAFANRATARLITVEARVLPGELGLISERVASAVVATGYDPPPDRLATIRGILRSEIIEIGARFNPGVTSHFAEAAVAAAEALHDAKPNRPIAALADDLRSEIIEIGATVLGDVNRTPQSRARRVLEIDRAAEVPPSAPETVPNFVRLRLVRDLPAPPDAEGPSKIYVSEDGTRLLVSWGSEGGVLYRESLGEGAGSGAEGPWSEPFVLGLGPEADPGEVESILRARVLQRP